MITGDGTWLNGTSNHQPPDLERSTEDFTQRALEQMNTSGSGIAYFVMTYSDNTKTIQNCKSKRMLVL